MVLPRIINSVVLIVYLQGRPPSFATDLRYSQQQCWYDTPGDSERASRFTDIRISLIIDMYKYLWLLS